MGVSEPCDIFYKTFLSLLMIGPALTVIVILFGIALIADTFVLLYFSLFGWMCEIEICDMHGKFILESLKCPWEPLLIVFEKFYKFYKLLSD